LCPENWQLVLFVMHAFVLSEMQHFDCQVLVLCCVVRAGI